MLPRPQARVMTDAGVVVSLTDWTILIPETEVELGSAMTTMDGLGVS
jgi:hypothetical protein